MASFGSGLAATVVVGVGWLVFILIWLAFYAGNFDFWQTILAIGITAVIWMKWAMG